MLILTQLGMYIYRCSEYNNLKCRYNNLNFNHKLFLIISYKFRTKAESMQILFNAKLVDMQAYV